MVNQEIVATMIGGRLVQKVTSVTLANNAALTISTTIPANKRWRLLGILIMNPDDVARLVTVEKWLEAAATNRLRRLENASVLAADFLHWPNLTNSRALGVAPHDVELFKGGNMLRVTWNAGGASAGGVDADGFILEYLEYDM